MTKSEQEHVYSKADIEFATEPQNPVDALRIPLTLESLQFAAEMLALGEYAEYLAYCQQLDMLNSGKFADKGIPYPPILKELQQKEDVILKERFPVEWEIINSVFRSADERWVLAESFRTSLIEDLKTKGIEDDYVIITGAKSNAKIFLKALMYGIPVDKIFDPVRARMVINSFVGQNDREKKSLEFAEGILRAFDDLEKSGKYRPMESIFFNRKDPLFPRDKMSPIHDPKKDTLRGGSTSGIPRGRRNFWYQGMIAEAQVMTSDTFKLLNEKDIVRHVDLYIPIIQRALLQSAQSVRRGA